MFLSDRDIQREMRYNRLFILRGNPRIQPNGVDLTLGPEYCYPNQLAAPLRIRADEEPSAPASAYYKCYRAKSHIPVNPNSVLLVHTREYIALPDNIMGIVGIRSSYARLGLYVPVTYVDPGFQGQLTIELRGGGFPVQIPVGAHVVYLALAYLRTPAGEPYRGIYNLQEGVRHSKFLRQKNL